MPEHRFMTHDDLHEPFGWVQSDDPLFVGPGKYWLDTSVTPNRIWRRNGDDTGWDEVGGGDLGAANLADLGDVSDVEPENGQALVWNSMLGTWSAQTIEPPPPAWDDVTDRPETFPPDTHTHTPGDIVGFGTAVGYIVQNSSLNDLSDVDAASPSDGDTLVWDATAGAWQAEAGGAGASTLDNLTDVDAADPDDGQALVWNDTAGAWQPATISTDTLGWSAITGKPSTFPPSTHTHTAADLPALPLTFTFGVPGALATGAQPVRLHAPAACTIQNVTATVGTAPTGASLIVDVNKNGTTIFTTQANRPTIAASAQDDLSSVPDVTSVAADDVLTIDIDQVGSTVAGSNLVVQVRAVRA